MAEYALGPVRNSVVESVVAELSAATHERPVLLGRYEVVGHLGSGGMSTVYEAVDRERGTKVALKTLSAFDASAGVSIKREFRVVADLAHPNLAPVYELTSERGMWFFTMERVEGVSLSRWTRGEAEDGDSKATGDLPFSRTLSTVEASHEATQAGAARRWSRNCSLDGEATVVESAARLPPSVDSGVQPTLPQRDMGAIRRAFGQITLGIGALHDAGLRHGDIKPANVLVRQDGQVVLVDFGLARPFDDLSSLHRSGGTPTYMAPEQLADAPVGSAADWYALGATLYGMLTGVRPFLADTKLELYLKKMHYPPPAPRALLPQLPEDLSDVCLALLNPDARERPGRDQLLRVFSGTSTPEVLGDRVTKPGFVGRDDELCALEQAYGTARGGQLTLAHVHGQSGIGKSALLTSFLNAVADVDSALILRGRCYERERVPYKGFDRIIDDLALYLSQQEPGHASEYLPAHTGALAKVFPALASIEAVALHAAEEVLPEGAMEVRRRAWSALRDLLAAVGKRRPIVLTIDDLQWSDTESGQLLGELLHGARDVPLLVVILYRPEEAATNEALLSYFERCKTLDSVGHFLDLPIAALSLRDAQRLARATLGAAATDANVAYIAQEAQGVPIFIEEMAHYLGKQNAHGVPELSNQTSLDDAIRARAATLEDRQRKLLEVVAIANSPLPQSIVFEAAELQPGELGTLLALRSAAFVNWLGAGADDVVSPYHDRIRESVLSALDHDTQQRHHLALARALAKRCTTAGSWLFDAVRHFAAADSLVVDPDERLRAAQLHARAGETAREAAAYPLGFSCFEAGIGLLGERAWQDHYELALRLHAGAVETAYLSAEREALERRSAEVKRNAHSVMDQLIAWETEIDACAGRQEYEAALRAGIAVLRILGVELTPDPGEADVAAAVEPTLKRLVEIGTEGLAALPELDDVQVAAITRVQVRLSPVAYFGRPLLLPIIACNLINTSIDRGLSTATPYALALFGIVLNTLDKYDVSHGWGMLALRLLDRWPKDRRLEAATRHILYNLVCNWMVPLSTMLDPLRKVFDIGRQTGDYEYAGFAAHGFVHNSIYAGRPLGPLKKEALWLGKQLEEFGVNATHVHRPFEQLLKALTGDLANPASLDDSNFDSEAIVAAAEANEVQSGALLCVIHLTIGLARFHFGDPAAASESLEKARAHLGGAPSVWHPPTVHLYAALAAGAAWRNTADPEEKARYSRRVEESLEPLRRLARLAPINFAHRVSLVESELARLDGDDRTALAKLERAIRQAQEGSWLNDVALANELAADCQSDDEGRMKHLRAARTGYAAWGATAKAQRIGERLQSLTP